MPKKMTPTIALCVVTHDDEQAIAACLASARAFVDELLVLDLGSTDRTASLAREQGARVESFAWGDDFAAARNAALERATTDWVLMLNPDERLDPDSGPALRQLTTQLPAGAHGYAVVVRRDQEVPIEHRAARFFPRRPEIRWHGTVHEQLVYTADPDATVLADGTAVRILHAEADSLPPSARRGLDSHRLLEQALARDPHDARLRYYLGESYSAQGRAADAARCFKECLRQPRRLPQPLVVDAFAAWLRALVTLSDGRAIERVRRRAEALGALSAAGRELLAAYYEASGRLSDARTQLVLALDPASSPMGLCVLEGVGGWRTRLHLAQINEQLGCPEQALDDLEPAYSDLPIQHRAGVALLAARLARQTGREAVARSWLDRAATSLPDELEAHTAFLELWLSTPGLADEPLVGPLAPLDRALVAADWQAAYDAAMRVPLESVGALARVLQLAAYLREHGAADAALDLLNRALDLHPASQPLYWLLVTVLMDLGRYEDAQTAVEVLQLLRREARQSKQRAA